MVERMIIPVFVRVVGGFDQLRKAGILSSPRAVREGEDVEVGRETSCSS